VTARRGLVPGLVLLVGLLLVAAGVVLLVRAGGGGGGDTSNRALVDSAETTQVIGQVSQALDQVLSYDYTKPQATEQAAAQLLTGNASTQYKTLFTALQDKAGDQKLTLVAKSVVAGVTTLTADRADLLVFLDQRSTRASDQATSTSAAQIQVTAVRQGDDWKISGLLAL
jgi:Mce-associated membrane protein